MNELDAYLEAHAETCEIHVARCDDCRLKADREAKSAIHVARSEVEQLPPLDDDICTYCGEPATDNDHLVPLPWTGPGARRFVPTVRSCRNCNQTLNDVPIFTIAGRCEHIAAHLRKRHRKQLAIPDRARAELNDYGHKMRTNLLAAQSRRQALRRRLIILDAGGAAFVPWLVDGRAA